MKEEMEATDFYINLKLETTGEDLQGLDGIDWYGMYGPECPACGDLKKRVRKKHKDCIMGPRST